MSFTLRSHAFRPSRSIPKKYTHDGANLSPPLRWYGVPEGTKSLALIVDDPDAPTGTWVHWVLYNLPGNVSMLSEGIPPRETIDNGACQGINDFKKLGFGGPDPPLGEMHRYFFKLYALDFKVHLPPGATKEELVKSLVGHILDCTELIG